MRNKECGIQIYVSVAPLNISIANNVDNASIRIDLMADLVKGWRNKMADTISGIKLILSDAQVFSDAISAVSKLVNEVTIKVLPDHLEVIALDPANVGMVILKIESKAFLGYSGEGNFSINLPNFKQVLARREKNATVTLSVDNNQLKVISSGKTKKEFTLPLLELEQKEQKEPELKFNSEITLENAELRDAIADVEIVAESCEFKILDGKFVISSSGDSGKAVSETKGIVRPLVEGAVSKARYSIEYLNNMLSAKFKNAKLYLGKDYPMKLHYVSDTGTTSITYILAPRIEND
jgi:proliferating cell nuclear antigen